MSSSLDSQLLNTILSSITDAVYALDSQFRFIYLNDQAVVHLEMSREELLGQNVWDKFPATRDTLIYREYHRVMRDRGKSRFFVYSPFSLRWLDLTVYALNNEESFPGGEGGLVVYFRDVTEEYQAKEELKRSETQLRVVSKTSGLALWTWDPQRDILLSQNALDQLLGRHFDSFAEVGPYLHPDDRKMARQVVEVALAQKNDYELEYRYARVSNPRLTCEEDWKWIWTKASVETNPDGSLLVLGINLDISARKVIENELAVSQERLREVALASGIGFWVWNGSRDELQFSFNTEAVFGFPWSNAQDVFPRVHPDDLEHVQAMVEKMLDQGGGIYIDEYRISRTVDADPTDDAAWKWVAQWATVRRNSEGEVILSGFMSDVTQSKTQQKALEVTQQRLERVARDARFSIFVWEPGRDQVHEKFQLDEFYGYEVVNGQQIAAHYHPDDVAPFVAQLRKLVENGAPLEIEFRTHRPEIENPDPNNPSHWRWVLCKVSLVSGPSQVPLIYGFNYDITERKEAEAALKETQNRLEKVASEAGIATWVWEPGRDIVHEKFLLDEVYGFEVTGWENTVPHFHPDDVAPTLAALNGIIASQRSDEVEFRIERFPGANPVQLEEWKTFLVKVSPARSSDGTTLLYGFNIDISQSRIAQENVRRSQQDYAALVSATTTIVWRASADGRTIQSTDWSDYTGQAPEDTANFGWMKMLHPDDVERIQTEWGTGLANPALVELRYRMWHHSGQYRHVLVRTVPIFEPDGVTLREWLGTVTDIHDQFEAQNAMRASEMRYRSLSAATNLIVWTASPDGWVRPDAPAWEKYTGQTFEELQGWGWMEMIHPDDRAPTTAIWLRALEEVQEFMLNYRVRHISGEWRLTEVRAVPVLDEAGQVVEWVGTINDIHDQRLAEVALRESEERYRVLTEGTPQIVWEAAPDGTVTFGNSYWMDYAELNLEEIRSGAWISSIHEDDRDLMFARWEHSQQTEGIFEMEMRYQRASDGQWRWHLARALPIFDANGVVQRWIGSATDIHERKLGEQLQEQFLEQEQQARLVAEEARHAAESASRMKDEFLAVVSHELRTPLNAILGWASLMRENKLDDETTRNGLEVIERNARAQAQIVEDILDIARVISGKLRIELRPINLEIVARDAIESVHPMAQSHNIRLTSDLLPLYVTGDAIRLRQVLWNLLQNAVKFTPNGGEVKLTMAREGENVLVVVSDSGVGIESDFLPHVFDRFRQADSSSTRPHGGLGLGLALVRSLVEAHQGSIKADSAGSGLGSTFTVTLPLRTAESAATPVVKSPPKLGRLAGMRIVVADDAADTLQLTAFVLRREGASVLVANSAEEARLLLQTEVSDLLLSDVAMPDEDGYQLLNWVKANNAELPVIAMTAFAGADEPERAAQAGFSAFIAKPIEMEKLISTIEAIRN